MNRLIALPVIGSAFVAACAAPPDEISSLPAESVPPAAVVASSEAPVDPSAAVVAAADRPADAPAIGDVVVVDMKEVGKDTGLVCEPKRRSGSRIARTVCTTREALAATEAQQAAAAQKYARDLERERAMKDQQGRMGDQQRGPAIIAFQ